MASIWRMPYFLLLAGVLALTARPASALDAKVALSAYHHAIWTAKDGAPGATTTMAQSTDGWLWLGSQDGLYRFDGVRFTRFSGQPGDRPAKRHVMTLNALPDGDLLVGYRNGGASRVHAGHMFDYPDNVDGVPLGPVSSLAVDHDGRLWATTTSNGLLLLQQGRWQKIGAAMGIGPGPAAAALADQYAQLWVMADGQLLVLPHGAARFHVALTGLPRLSSLVESPDGRLWVWMNHKLLPVPPQHQGPSKPRPARLALQESQDTGLFDRDGNLWEITCPVGICRVPGAGLRTKQPMRRSSSASDRLDQPWQLSSTMLLCLFEDSDGDIWVSTAKGLERFRHNRLTPVTLDGSEDFFFVARDMAGKALVRTVPNGALWDLSGPRPLRLPERFANPYGMIANAADGSLLVATPDAIERRGKSGVERVAYPSGSREGSDAPSVTRLNHDGVALWLGISGHGTFRHDADGWTGMAKLGLPPTVAFATPAEHGAMWFAYPGPRVVHYGQGRTTSYNFDAANDIGPITFLRGAGGGTGAGALLAGGESGLALLLGGRFRRLAAANPEALHSISGLIIDERGDRWLNGYLGVLRVRAADWQATLGDPAVALKYTLFGVLDGYPGRAATITRLDSAIAGEHGQLWFVTSGGLATLDSRSAYPRLQAPKAVIETLATQGRTLSALPAALTLAPGTTSLRLEYTALSYARPEALRFRYRLDGLDAGWQEAGARRAVSYTNLGPGDYRFRVSAVDDSGQASATEQTLALHILPTFTQTPWFVGLCATAGAALLYLLFRLRLRQATARVQERLAERLAERERIARTLHDSFLQSVHTLTLTVGSVLATLPSDSAARKKIENTLTLAERVMQEGRNEVQELRAFAASSAELARALALLGEALADSQGIAFSLRTDGDAMPLPEQVCSEIYCIGREALVNAFRHAGAGTIDVSLTCAPGQLLLQVGDDGCGIAAQIVADGQRAGHWGLSGMRERASALGATLVIASTPGGTRISLNVTLVRRHGRLAQRLLKHWRIFLRMKKYPWRSG